MFGAAAKIAISTAFSMFAHKYLLDIGEATIYIYLTTKVSCLQISYLRNFGVIFSSLSQWFIGLLLFTLTVGTPPPLVLIYWSYQLKVRKKRAGCVSNHQVATIGNRNGRG